MTEAYDSLVESYQAVDGVECTGSAADGVYTIAITIDTTGDAVSKLAEQGLLQVDGGTNGISLEKTGEALEAGGYTKGRIKQDDAEAPAGLKRTVLPELFSCNRKFLWNPLLHEKYYRIKFAKYILSHSVKQLKQA